MRALNKSMEKEAQLWPDLTENLTCQMLHIPEHTVAQLKVGYRKASRRLPLGQRGRSSGVLPLASVHKPQRLFDTRYHIQHVRH